MKQITVLVTGVGAPGTWGTRHSLTFGEQKVRVIGVDMEDDVVGRYLCDSFYQVPDPSNDNYISTLLRICKKEKVNVVLPQTTKETLKLCHHHKIFNKNGVKLAVSKASAVEKANNKYKLLELAKTCTAVPKYYLVQSFGDLEKYVVNLGYPEKPVVIKPPVSWGMRGFRILSEQKSDVKSFFSEKPSGIYLSLNQMRFMKNNFQPLLVMEYLPNTEYTVDVLAQDGNTLVAIPRRRDQIRSGITFKATVCKVPEIFYDVQRLVRKLELSYACGFQFKSDEGHVPRLLECNPRIQGSMVLSTYAGANIIYGAVKLALGESIPEFKIRWGTRMHRYWGATFNCTKTQNGEWIECQKPRKNVFCGKQQ